MPRYESDKRSFVPVGARSDARPPAGRLALGERDRLISLRVFKQDINHVRITFRLTRYAPDFLARGIHGRLAQGGGTVDCAHGKVACLGDERPVNQRETADTCALNVLVLRSLRYQVLPPRRINA